MVLVGVLDFVIDVVGVVVGAGVRVLVTLGVGEYVGVGDEFGVDDTLGGCVNIGVFEIKTGVKKLLNDGAL